MKKKNSKKLIFYLSILAISMMTVQACKTYQFRSNYQDANKLLHDTKDIQTKPYLKGHLKNGDICILKDSWQVDTVQDVVTGYGSRYDFNRTMIFDGIISIPIDSVAIFETNKKLIGTESARIAALSVLAALNVVMGIVCITDPKACFGSCPTFYINETDYFHYADAESFSNAILPSMEYFDIDALYNGTITGPIFSITMKNEALETHCVENVKLLAFPKKNGERIYQSPKNDFYLCKNNYQASQAIGQEGDIKALIDSDDRQERFSLADKDNLSTKEEIYLNFGNIKNPHDLGLIVDFRQTLMTTYFIYNAMGYMGDEVGDYFAKMEIDAQTKEKVKNGIRKELGDIDVYVWNEQNQNWEIQGGIYETGPIALNRQILPLTNIGGSSDVRLKIVMNKGLWRIDYLALTNIKEKVNPVEITPNVVFNMGKKDEAALTQITTSGKYLISMPGSEYKFNFIMPKEGQDYELFLYSKGYYLEWMREHWLQDKNLSKLKQMVESPKKYLRVEAKDYKRYETAMEQEFWNSKIDTRIFSYYEN